jgi:tRNA(Ile2) C34 agmatinyltransferase TiaS
MTDEISMSGGTMDIKFPVKDEQSRIALTKAYICPDCGGHMNFKLGGRRGNYRCDDPSCVSHESRTA